jgi:hypothetical protein
MIVSELFSYLIRITAIIIGDGIINLYRAEVSQSVIFNLNVSAFTSILC